MIALLGGRGPANPAKEVSVSSLFLSQFSICKLTGIFFIFLMGNSFKGEFVLMKLNTNSQVLKHAFHHKELYFFFLLLKSDTVLG